MFAALLLALAAADCPATDSTGAVPPSSERLPVGEAKPGWCAEGDDFFALVGPDAVPARQVVVGDDPVDFVDRYQREPWRSPRDWRLIDNVEAKAPPNGSFYDLLVKYRGDRLIAVTVHPAWRVGKAVCVTESGPTFVYRTDGQTPDVDDEYQARELLSEIDPEEKPATLCATAMRIAGDRYRLRYYDTLGRSADQLNEAYEGELLRILPQGPLETPPGVSR